MSFTTHTLNYGTGAFEGMESVWDAIIQLARRELGVETVERRVSRGQLYDAAECFLTGSLSGMKPVKSVDHHPIGAGGPGPLRAGCRTST